MIGVQVDFALLLFDEFSGAALRDGMVQFHHQGKRVTPMRKKGGFYVFRNLPQPLLEMEISRPHYQKKQQRIEKNKLDSGFPVVRVRLLRQYCGVYGDCEWLHGSCTPQSQVLALAQEGGLRVGMLEPDEAGTKISLLGYAQANLLGRRVALDPKGKETFILQQMCSPGVYLTNKAGLQSAQGGGSLYRVYLTQSGLDGSFALPVDVGKSSEINKVACWDKESEQWVSVSAAALPSCVPLAQHQVR